MKTVEEALAFVESGARSGCVLTCVALEILAEEVKRMRVPLGEESAARTAVEIMEESWAGGSTYWEDKDGSAERELMDDAAALDAKIAQMSARVAELEAPRSPNALELADNLCAHMDNWNAHAEEYGEDSRATLDAEQQMIEAREVLKQYDDRRCIKVPATAKK